VILAVPVRWIERFPQGECRRFSHDRHFSLISVGSAEPLARPREVIVDRREDPCDLANIKPDRRSPGAR
jgi:hypothetical protein